MPHALLRVLVSTAIASTVITAVLPAAQAGTGTPAQAGPQTPAQVREKPADARITPVPAVQEPPPAVVSVARRPSLALQPIGDQRVGPGAPVVTTPAGPGLADRITAAAGAVQQRQGYGRGLPDTGNVLPDTSQARPLGLAKAAEKTGKAVEELGDTLGKVTSKVLPKTTTSLSDSAAKTVSGVTYRLCVESADVPVSCSARRPVTVPMYADVTGDDKPDLVADLVPATEPGKGVAGLTFTVKRLGKQNLKAQVWAEYDGKVSVGFDGLRRGSSLSASDTGTFTVDLAGKRVKAVVERKEPGASAALVAGLKGGNSVSLRQTPATTRLTVNAALGEPSLDVAASAPARLEAVAVTRSRFTHAVLDRMSTRAQVRVTGGKVTFTSSASVGRAELDDLSYRDGRLSRVIRVDMDRVPASFTAHYRSAKRKQTLSAATAKGGAGRTGIVFYDRGAGRTVIKAQLSAVPGKVDVVNDMAARRVTHSASAPIKDFAVVLQRGGGAISTPRGGHVTMIKDGAAFGVSGRLSGLRGFDVTYGAAPHARLDAAAGGGPFVGAASIDRTHLVRLELSNTPATVDVTLDPAARKAVYRAGGVIGTMRAAYANVKSGPTVDGTVLGVRDSVEASWALGERSAVKVASSGKVRSVRIYANKAHVTSPSGEDVRAVVEGLNKRAELVADTKAQTLTWDADGPVSKVTALARVKAGGRYARAAARVTGVPAAFDASWAAGAYRFRGLSGPVGSAEVAFTNHGRATSPAGPHLAVHYDQAGGDLDASVRVEKLKQVELTPSPQGLTAGLDAAGRRITVDADIRQGDDRFGLLGTVGPVPGRFSVASDAGRLTYTGSRLDVKARAWLGKAAALGRMRAAPAVAGGVSLVDGACTPGRPGCAQGSFCVARRGCFGLQGYLDVSGLPEQVTVDLGGRTFAFSGFQPRNRSLDVYLASSVLSPVPVKARAKLTGLPEKITGMSLGPISVSEGNAVQAAYTIEPAATLGALSVRAETAGLRGRLAIDPVPASFAFQGAYGAKTRIRVSNSAPVKHLSAKVTLPGKGTGELSLSDVPAIFGVDADASAAGLSVPAVTYKAVGNVNTLDGRLSVEGGLVDPSGRLGDVALSVRDLAADTTIRLNPDQSLDLVSRPVPTGRITVRGGLRIDGVPAQKLAVDKEVPHTGGFLTYHVGGRFGLRKSSVEQITFSISRMSWLKLRPGRIPFGLKAPAALGYVAPGFEGSYGTVKIAAKGVDLRPEVTLDIKLSREIGSDVFRQSVRIGRTGSLALRRYDQRMRRIGAKQEVKAAGIGLACITVDAKPGFAAGGGAANRITLRGADGPQMVSLLDPGGQVPDYAVDLLTHFMSPFPGAEWKVSGLDAGSCGPDRPGRRAGDSDDR